MKNIIKRMLGIDKLEKDLAEKLSNIAEAPVEIAKPVPVSLTPKEQATLNKEPYVSVTNTHVNPENIRTGFLELDWNEYFILQLKENGYVGDNEETIVDQWFQELCKNIGGESGVDMSRRGSGFVNIPNSENSI